MGKVKLTREQAEAIERGIKIYGETRIMNDHEPDAWVGNLVNLNGITKDEMARALYIGYEVEETFEAGDWVKVNWRDEKPSIHKVRKVINTFVIIDGEQDNTNPPTQIIEHATPEEIAEEKQRRWWAKHGRDVWELREGDCLISKYDKHTCQVKFVESSDEVSVLLVDCIQDEFYEGEHDLQILRDSYKVFCFAEDRKDIKQ